MKYFSQNQLMRGSGWRLFDFIVFFTVCFSYFLAVLATRPYFGHMDDGGQALLAQDGRFTDFVFMHGADYGYWGASAFPKLWQYLTYSVAVWKDPVAAYLLNGFFYIGSVWLFFYVIWTFGVIKRKAVSIGFLGVFLWPFSYEAFVFLSPTQITTPFVLMVVLTMLLLASASKSLLNNALLLFVATLIILGTSRELLLFMPLVLLFLLSCQTRFISKRFFNMWLVTLLVLSIFQVWALRTGSYTSRKLFDNFGDVPFTPVFILMSLVLLVNALWILFIWARKQLRLTDWISIVGIVPFWLAPFVFVTRNYYFASFGLCCGLLLALVWSKFRSIRLQVLLGAALFAFFLIVLVMRAVPILSSAGSFRTFLESNEFSTIVQTRSRIYVPCAEAHDHLNYYSTSLGFFEINWYVDAWTHGRLAWDSSRQVAFVFHNDIKQLHEDIEGKGYGYMFSDGLLCTAPSTVRERNVLWDPGSHLGFRLSDAVAATTK